MGQDSDLSFEEFFAPTYGRLVGLLFAFLHDRAQAEDVVQDALASALLHWPVLRRYHDPEAWVRMVAFRRVIDHRRTARQLQAVLRLGPPTARPAGRALQPGRRPVGPPRAPRRRRQAERPAAGDRLRANGWPPPAGPVRPSWQADW